jgi:hypothetical protein
VVAAAPSAVKRAMRTSRLDPLAETARAAAEDLEARPVAELVEDRRQLHPATTPFAMKLLCNSGVLLTECGRFRMRVIHHDRGSIEPSRYLK